MKRILAVISLLLLLFFFVDMGIAQTRNYQAGWLKVQRYIQTLRGAYIINGGFYRQQYSGTTQDAFEIDYTGSGNLFLNFLADNAPVFTMAKNGDITATGIFTIGGMDANDINIGIAAVNEIDTDSGNLVLDSAGGTVDVDDNIDITGHFALGDGAVSSSITAEISETYTDTSGFVYGYRNYVNIEPATDTSVTAFATFANVENIDGGSEDYTGTFYGGYYQAQHEGSGQMNGLVGGYFIGWCDGDGDVTSSIGGRLVSMNEAGTMTESIGVRGGIRQRTGAGTTIDGYSFKSRIDNTLGSITRAHGYYFTDPEAAATIGTLYGLYLEEPTKGTTNYSIYSAGGNSYHGGDIEFAQDDVSTTITTSSYHDTEDTTPTLTLRKADGSEAVPAAIDQDAVLGTINFNGYDDDGWDNGARIYAKADANWGAAERGTDLFIATRDGAGGLTDQFTVTANGNFNGVTSKWYFCKYIDAISVAPGGSGATQTLPDVDTLGGYLLDADTEYLYFNARACPNWDETSDPMIAVTFEVNVDNTGGNVADTVDFDLLCYYKGAGGTANKTQTPTCSIIVGQSAQYVQFTVDIMIDHDIGGGNDVAVRDVFSFRLNLNTTASEVDNVIVNFFMYHQTGFKVQMQTSEAS